MRVEARLGMLIVASTLLMQNAARAQRCRCPSKEHAMSRGAGSIKAGIFRDWGERRTGAGNSSRWSRLQKIAGESNPTLAASRSGNSRDEGAATASGALSRIRRWETRGMKIRGGSVGAESRDSLCSSDRYGRKLGLSRDVFGKRSETGGAGSGRAEDTSAERGEDRRSCACWRRRSLDARRDMAKLRRTQPKPSGG